MSERTWTVAEIGQRIEQVVTDRMASAFWVRGEVADLGRTPRGMAFLSLVQTDGGGRVLARLPATVSPGKLRLVDRRMARVGQPLADGLEVRVRAHLEWFTPSGRLSAAVEDIDPAHTAGQMALARRRLLDDLVAEGLLDANAGRPTPRLPLRIGVITRKGSQAYHDLVDELRAGELPFHVVLVSSGVQGVSAPAELTAAVHRLGARGDLDLLLLTRGGGAEADLATFDHPDLARAIAACPIPVWTGIGHHLDVPVAEQVAARAFKTPTALGQGVVASARAAVDRTEATWAAIQLQSSSHLSRARTRLSAARQRTQSARVVLRGADGRLDAAALGLRASARRQAETHRQRADARTLRLRAGATAAARLAATRLDTAEGLVAAHDPARLLARGWSVTTTDDGALVTGPVPVGTALRTRTRGGSIRSAVVDGG